MAGKFSASAKLSQVRIAGLQVRARRKISAPATKNARKSAISSPTTVLLT